MYRQAFFGVRLGISNKLPGTIIHAYIKHHRNLNFSVALKNDLSTCSTFITFTKYLLKSLTYTLIKFPESSSSHGWVISPVHFGNVITFDILNLIHCKISRKRNLIALRNFNLNIHLSIRQIPNKFTEKHYRMQFLLVIPKSHTIIKWCLFQLELLHKDTVKSYRSDKSSPP